MKEDCLFCKIINRQIPADIIYEDEEIIAFNDINPQAPLHALVIPKQHIEKVSDIDSKNSSIIGDLTVIANKIAKDKDLTKVGYRLVFNCGKAAGQAVFHIHLHLLGGRNLTWPPG